MRLSFAFLLFAFTLSAQTPKKIVVLGDTALAEKLQGVSPLANIVLANRETAAQEIADADAIIGVPKAAEIRQAKKLQWLQVPSAGVENVLHLSGGNDLRDSNIVLTNNQIVQGPEIADHAFAMLLTLSRDLPRLMALQKTNQWVPRPYRGIELNGKTAVVIGVGGIGMQISQRAWAFGMQVIGVDPEDIPFSPFVKQVVKPDQLAEVLPQADVVFVSAPHTPKSHRMLGEKEFSAMKQGSYFIAVSRGALYELGSLVKALDSKRLAGAGVDVLDPEPLPKEHPLWGFENAIITPHIAGRSDRDNERMVNTIKENVRRFVEGKPLKNVVDKQKGY